MPTVLCMAVAVDPRFLTLPGRSTSGFHRGGSCAKIRKPTNRPTGRPTSRPTDRPDATDKGAAAALS